MDDLNIQEDLYGTPRDEEAWNNRLEEDERRALQHQTLEKYAAQEAEDSPESPSTEGDSPAPDDGVDIKDVAEVALAIPTGALDFGVGLLNKLPHKNAEGIPRPFSDEEGKLKTLPEFENRTAQAIRDISSVVLPAIAFTRGFGLIGKAAHARVGWKLGNDAFVKWLSNAGIAGLGGVVADEIAPVQERDHNAMGMLKQSYPQTWGWISDDWATLDSDSPDVKRAKNRNEGLGLGFAADVLLGAGKLAKSLKGVDKATTWVPENEKASTFLKKLNDVQPLTNDPIEDAILQSATRRADEFADLGETNLKHNIELGLNEPAIGRHNVYEYYEQGMRSSDPGRIVVSSVDQVRIQDNIGTVYGRLGNPATEGAMKDALKLNDAGLSMMKIAADDLAAAGKYGYKVPNGSYIAHSRIDKVGKDLAAQLYGVDVAEMHKILDPFSAKEGAVKTTVLDAKGMKGVKGAIKKYMDDYNSMDIMKAQAYIGTSFAGQVSDIAEGARLMNSRPTAVIRAQEQILDRLNYLMMIQGQTKLTKARAGAMQALKSRLAKKTLTPDEALEVVKNEENATLKSLARLQAETEGTIETFRAVQKERPEMLSPLMLAYEMTDGNVKSITALNEYIRNTTGVVKKAFFDGKPQMPSAWTQGMWSNIYNSILSAVGTPIKAGMSNLVLSVQRPLATYAGALVTGDKEVLKRASYMYNVGMVDTLQKAYSHMNQVFRRAANDPDSVGYIMRDDISRKNAQTMDILRTFADAKSAEDLHGPTVIVNQIEAMNDLAEHPWLRFSANSMTAFDGFTRSYIGSIEARGRAYDQLFRAGKEITNESVTEASQKLYRDMFDERGFITDSAVEYASREIAMNLDNKVVTSLNDMISRAPALKPFLMFPKTSTNMLQFAGTHNPLGLFINELNQFKLPFNQMNPEEAITLLASKGIPIDENIEIAYNTMRAELKGRKALGTMAVFGAVGLFSTNRLTGTGLYDKTRQRTRRELGWKPKSFQGWDGRWYSYEGLGPLGDWLSLTTDIMDNFDTLDDPTIETHLNKMGHILSANITNKAFISGLEPLNDVLAGNPSAMARWSASFSGAFIPGSGFRNELARLLHPQMKEADQSFTELWANRNPIQKGNLPDLYDWMDGGKVGEPLDFMTRVRNVYFSMWKSHDKISPEKQFLIDIEFDGRPSLQTNGRGVEYSPAQRSEITDLIGRDKMFVKEVRRIMKTTDAKRFRKELKEAQRKGQYVDLKDFQNLHYELTYALREAQTWAEGESSSYEAIMEQQYIQEETRRRSRLGDVNEILDLQRN